MMKFANMNIVLLAILAFASCSQVESKENDKGKDQVVIQGKIENPASSGHIILEEVQNNNMVPIDTITLGQDNTFKESVTVKEPGFYRLNLYGKQAVMLVLNEQDIKIEADLNSEQPAKVEGSKDTDYLEQINTVVQGNQEKIKALEQEYLQAKQATT